MAVYLYILFIFLPLIFIWIMLYAIEKKKVIRATEREWNVLFYFFSWILVQIFLWIVLFWYFISQ